MKTKIKVKTMLLVDSALFYKLQSNNDGITRPSTTAIPSYKPTFQYSNTPSPQNIYQETKSGHAIGTMTNGIDQKNKQSMTSPIQKDKGTYTFIKQPEKMEIDTSHNQPFNQSEYNPQHQLRVPIPIGNQRENNPNALPQFHQTQQLGIGYQPPPLQLQNTNQETPMDTRYSNQNNQLIPIHQTPIQFAQQNPSQYAQHTPIQYEQQNSTIEYAQQNPIQYTQHTPVQYSQQQPINYTQQTPIQYTQQIPIQYSQQAAPKTVEHMNIDEECLECDETPAITGTALKALPNYVEYSMIKAPTWNVNRPVATGLPEIVSFICELCNSKFKKKATLERHMKQIHDAFNQKEKGIKRKHNDDTHPNKFPKLGSYKFLY